MACHQPVFQEGKGGYGPYAGGDGGATPGRRTTKYTPQFHSHGDTDDEADKAKDPTNADHYAEFADTLARMIQSNGEKPSMESSKDPHIKKINDAADKLIHDVKKKEGGSA